MNKIISVVMISTLVLVADSSHISNSNNLQELQHRTANSSSTVRNSGNSMLVRHQGSVGGGSSAPSQIQANKNINLNLVNKSTIKSSSVGMKIRAKGSKVQSNKNINLDLVNKSDIENSNVGLAIDAK